MSTKPDGIITRGTTAPNRLRRIDRWLTAHPVTRRPGLVVDLGFGNSPVTCFELAHRLTQVNPHLRIIGLEIDPERLTKARLALKEISSATQNSLVGKISFARGGFEIPTAEDPIIIRAANVLRQYPADEVEAIWLKLQNRLAPGGIIIDATCSENGQITSWVQLNKQGPQSLVISLKLRNLVNPAKAAERLPKILINRNKPGENIHSFLLDLAKTWQQGASLQVFGARQRWINTCQTMRNSGWKILGSPKRWKLGEIEVAWHQVS